MPTNPQKLSALKKDLERVVVKYYPDWTEDNVHDPGITVLELLVYAINDVAYRPKQNPCDVLIRILERRGFVTREVKKRRKK